MKIIKETSNLMILKDKNIAAFIFGIIFFLGGLVVILKPNFFTNQPPLWSGIAGVIIGGLVIIMAKITTIKLDKSANKLSFLQKGIVGQTYQEYDLNQIKEVELSAVYTYNNLRTPREESKYSYRLAFIFNNGEIVPLKSSRSSTAVMGQRIIPEKTLGIRIATFLGVPFQERRPLTVNETLSTISSTIQSAAEKETEKQRKI